MGNTEKPGWHAFVRRRREVSGTWITGRKPASEHGFVVSIMVTDIQASIQLVIENGGRMIEMPKPESQEKIASFSDPFDNTWGLYHH